MLSFVKMQGLGNDYIYIDNNKNKHTISYAKICPKLCKNKFGVGGDGIIVINPCKNFDASIDVYNKDGTKAKVCGNATRCVAFYLSRKLNKSKIKIKSAGIVLKSIVYPQNKTQANVLTKWNSAKILKSKGNKFLIYCGNLHLVIFVKNFNFDVEKCGKKLNIQTKNKVNIEFVKIKKENELQVKVYERGSGITYACGSGAIASAVAYLNNKEKDKKIKIFLDGGELYIYQHNKKIFMRGKANIVYKGETNLDEFC